MLIKGGKAYLRKLEIAMDLLDVCDSYHDQKAIKKPHQEKKNTLPYLLIGLRIGMLRAFWLTGLRSGALQRLVSVPMSAEDCRKHSILRVTRIL